MHKVREGRRTQQKKKIESNQRAERKIRGMHCPLPIQATAEIRV